ncbi:MAG: DNA-formamidopyrimidine glycosylase, partial [Actinomycetales bacterium]|nr:DNA-formamidopyrimidine glycosylase [Actinomycetales bacterium]
MPELPEVETVRDGLARHVLGRTITRAHVFRDYSVRRHEAGPVDFAARLAGRTLTAAARRGKYLWLELGEPDGPPAEALLAHLGMSGQLLVRSSAVSDGDSRAGVPPVPDPDEANRTHLRVRLELDDGGVPGGGGVLDFVDQRAFGYLAVAELAPTPDGQPGGLGATAPLVPVPVAHVARDLLDPALDRAEVAAAMRRRRTVAKRALLDQTLVSGVGNIYADEALWRARLHGERPTAA